MRLLHSKAVPGPISLVTLCHEMDLVAVAARSSIAPGWPPPPPGKS